MTLNLTNEDIQTAIFEHCQNAMKYYELGMILNFLCEYYKARTYLDLWYKLGYLWEDLENYNADYLTLCERQFPKIQINKV